MNKDVTSNLNGIFDEEEKTKKKKKQPKKKNQKKEMKRKKREEEKLEKMEDEAFLKMKEEELEKSIPELYLTQVDEIPYQEQEKNKKNRKKEKKDVSDFFDENDEFTFIEKKTASRLERTRSLDIPKEEKPGFFSMLYDTIFGFFLITMLLVAGAYLGIQIYHKEEIKVLMISSTLAIGIFTYVISMVTKKDSIKKLFAILSSICICAFIVLTFYVAS